MNQILPVNSETVHNSPSSSGLVYISTSDTVDKIEPFGFELPVFLDSHKLRLSNLKHSTLTTARLMTEGLQRGGNRFKAAMITLTYADINGWQPKHITEFCKRVRMHLQRRNHAFRYAWVMELQKRGAPHYHLIVWLPKGVTLPKADKCGWWPYGFTNAVWARNAVGYLAKYASKGGESKDFPSGARLFGSGGLTFVQRAIRSWWRLPVNVRDIGGVEYLWKKRKGGGFFSRTYGLIVESMYKLSFFPSGGVALVLNKGQKLVRGGLELNELLHHFRLCASLEFRSLFEHDRVEWIKRLPDFGMFEEVPL